VKAVLDTNVFISGLFWQGPPERCLSAARIGLYELILSEPILSELASTLERKFPFQRTRHAVEYIERIGSVIPITHKVQVIPEDPTDDKFIEAALSAPAPVIVSGDRHLIRLGRYENIEIVRPAVFLKTFLKLDRIP